MNTRANVKIPIQFTEEYILDGIIIYASVLIISIYMIIVLIV
jgi:hypothetical protein